MSLRERTESAAGLVLATWGLALLCLAVLDLASYQRFLASLLFR
jgi:hypothetical protein